MGGKGGGSHSAGTQTTTNSPWSPEQYYLKELFRRGEAQSNQPYPGPAQQVSPFNPAEMQGMNLELGAIPGQQGIAAYGNRAMGSLGGISSGSNPFMVGLGNVASNNFLNNSPATGYERGAVGGQYLSPSSNPYLKSYANAAVEGLVNNYQTATAPSNAFGAINAGAFGGSAGAEQQALSQFNLARAIGDTEANIYEPAYQHERDLQQAAANSYNQQYLQEQGIRTQADTNAVDAQLRAAGLAPSIMSAQSSALLAPGETALGVGGLQQSQQQREMDARYNNAYNQGFWPYEQLSNFQNILGAGSGLGTSVTHGTYPSNQPGWGQSLLGGGLLGASIGQMAGGPAGAGWGAGLGALTAFL